MRIRSFLRLVTVGMVASSVLLSGCIGNVDKNTSDVKESSIAAESSVSEKSEAEESSEASQTGLRMHFKDLAVGGKSDLRAECGKDGNTYKSDSPDVADVDENGIVHALSIGSAEITVSKNGVVTDKYVITVLENQSSGEKSSEESEDSSSAPEESSENSQESKEESSDKSSTGNNKITPAVWKVTDKSGNVMYMMGTIHSADKDAAELPDYFENAFSQCDSLAVECDITNDDTALSMMYLSKYMYSDGTTIKDHISAEAYTNAKKILTDAKMYSQLVDNYKPVLWVQFFELIASGKAGLEEKYGVDRNLINKAKKTGREVLELESAQFQLQLLADLPDETQELMMELEAKDGIIEELTKQLKDVYDNWKTGKPTYNEVGEEEYDKEGLNEHQKRILKDYNKTLLDDRNVGMADKAEQYMKDGKKVMLAVGANHFYGKNGLVELMKKKGCKVEPLK